MNYLKNLWLNSDIRKLIKGLILIYSDQPSLLGKKRIESGFAFFFSLGATACFVWHRRDMLNIYEFMWIITTWLFVAGYTVNQIQKEKSLPFDKTDLPEELPKQ